MAAFLEQQSVEPEVDAAVLLKLQHPGEEYVVLLELEDTVEAVQMVLLELEDVVKAVLYMVSWELNDGAQAV